MLYFLFFAELLASIKNDFGEKPFGGIPLSGNPRKCVLTRKRNQALDRPEVLPYNKLLTNLASNEPYRGHSIGTKHRSELTCTGKPRCARSVLPRPRANIQNLPTVVTQHPHMLSGGSHVSRGPILLLGNSICHRSRFAECSHKSEKNNLTPHILSLGRLCFQLSFT